MKTIETVNIEDVYPVVDEYGNEYLSRDYSTKENKDYIEELARSMAAKGVPDEPVVLVRDGGIYRIKAGNSRVLAMRKLGTKQFDAVIDEDDTPQSLIETVVRTNTKKKYEALEESRYIQQLGLFGTDAYVAEVSGIEEIKVKKARRGAKLVQDAAEDMTIDRLIAIGEFEDDPAVVKKLTNCSEREFRTIYADLSRKRIREENLNKVESMLIKLGVKIVDKVPDSYSYYTRLDEPDEVRTDTVDPAHDIAVRGVYGYNIYFPGTCKKTPEEIALEQERADRKSRMKVVEDARLEWFLENYKNPDLKLYKLIKEPQGCYTYSFSQFVEDNNIEIPVGIPDLVYFFLDNYRKFLTPLGDFDADSDRIFTDIQYAMTLDGYSMPEEETVLNQQSLDFFEENGD